MSRPRIGFSCLWGPVPQDTWSHTPWQLRAAMARQGDVVPAGVTLGGPTRAALKGLHVRLRHGRPITTWKQSRLTDAVCAREIGRQARRQHCDAVLEIQDLAVLELPYFVYQDMSFDALLAARQAGSVPLYRGMSDLGLRRRQERQHRVYQGAAGVLAMSHWLARSLVEQSGLPAQRVHVVQPGVSARGEPGRPLVHREGPRRRLLFVGREFTIKGGPLTVAALAVLRRQVDPRITLTVVGPAVWPMAGEPPDGVRFLGPRSLAEVAALYDEHDLFVMPSHLEGFGIALAEAGTRGLPCVARDAYAMSEIIEPGVTGALVAGDDPVDLATVIAAILADDGLYERCLARSAGLAEHYTWERAGRDALSAITRTLAR